MDSPFEILGVDSDADEGEIDRAYKRRVKEAHPDQGGSVRGFLRVQAAYEKLTSEAPPQGELGPGPEGADRDGTGDDRRGPRGPRPGGRDDDREPGRTADGDDRGVEARVQYLNYEVLDDHGWDLDDPDLFAKASDAGLDPEDCGRFVVQSDESLLEAAENRGFTWPYACRGGACANCAVAVLDGDLSMPVSHVLPSEMTDRGIRLSCVGTPVTGDMKVVYNLKHLPALEELRLPPSPFERAMETD
ncbi:MAG: ferredoxin Fer [Haloferacaceae archaeon]